MLGQYRVLLYSLSKLHSIYLTILKTVYSINLPARLKFQEIVEIGKTLCFYFAAI
jgi:hypothetical protein